MQPQVLAVAAGAALVLAGGIVTVATGAADDSHPARIAAGATASPAATPTGAPQPTPAATTPAAPPTTSSSPATTPTEAAPTASPAPSVDPATAHHTYTYPDVIEGLPKQQAETAKANKQFTSVSVDGKTFHGAVYGGDSGIVFIADLPLALTGERLQRGIQGGISGLSKEFTVGTLKQVKPGPLGGLVECAKVTRSDVPGTAVLCVWSDSDSFGYDLVLRPPGSAGASVMNPSLALQAREAVEHVTV